MLAYGFTIKQIKKTGYGIKNIFKKYIMEK